MFRPIKRSSQYELLNFIQVLLSMLTHKINSLIFSVPAKFNF